MKFKKGDRVKDTGPVTPGRKGIVVTGSGEGAISRFTYVSWDDDPKHTQYLELFKDDQEYCDHVRENGLPIPTVNLKRCK